jgi:uncharacterized membrane protein YfcA
MDMGLLLSGNQAAFLLGAGVLAGALNAVAGGGSFISFPALIYCGVLPVSANATNALATWPGLLGASWGYRDRLRPHLRALMVLALLSVVGGAAGGLLIVVTPPGVFARLVPVLLLVGTLLLLANLFRPAAKTQTLDTESLRGLVPQSAFDRRSLGQFAVALYGGYFVGGAGLVQMATLSLFGIEDIQVINGLKNVFGVLMSGAALVTLIASGKVSWLPAIVLTMGSVIGGLSGSRLAQRINPRLLRIMVVVFGFGMTIYFFHKFY